MAKIINWFGIESHPTDDYIHWSEKPKERLKKAERLRKAYDAIIVAGLEDELKDLLNEARDAGRDDEREMNATADW